MRGLATPSGWESGAGSVGRCASFGVPTPCSDRTPRSRKHLIFKGCHKSHVLSSILKPLASTRQIINKLSVRTLSNLSVRTILFRSATERATATSCTQQQVPSQPHRPAGARRNSRRTPHRAQPPRPTPRSIITTDTINTTSLHDRHRNHEPYEDSEQRTVIDIITHPARKPLTDREVMTAATDPQPAAPTSRSTSKLTPNTPPSPAAETDTETDTEPSRRDRHQDRHQDRLQDQSSRPTPCPAAETDTMHTSPRIC